MAGETTFGFFIGEGVNMEVMQLNPVINGPERWCDTINEMLRTHKHLAWLLRSDIKEYLDHLDRVKRPHKSHRTRYERCIEDTRKRLRASKRAIQTIKRYGLLELPRDLELPIIPYIMKATEIWSDPYDIDQAVEHNMTGFIGANRRAKKHYPGDLHKVIDFITKYGHWSKENQDAVMQIKGQIFQTYFSMLGQIMNAAFLRNGDHGQQVPESRERARLRVVG